MPWEAGGKREAVISGFGGVTHFDVNSENGRIVLTPVRFNRADAVRANRIASLASRDTMTELIRVLCYPRFALTDAEREDLLADYLTYAETVVVSPVPIVPACRDRFDRAFLELTLAGRADAPVTGDKDLLVLAGDFPVPIVSPPSPLR